MIISSSLHLTRGKQHRLLEAKANSNGVFLAYKDETNDMLMIDCGFRKQARHKGKPNPSDNGSRNTLDSIGKFTGKFKKDATCWDILLAAKVSESTTRHHESLAKKLKIDNQRMLLEEGKEEISIVNKGKEHVNSYFHAKYTLNTPPQKEPQERSLKPVADESGLKACKKNYQDVWVLCTYQKASDTDNSQGLASLQVLSLQSLGLTARLQGILELKKHTFSKLNRLSSSRPELKKLSYRTSSGQATMHLDEELYDKVRSSIKDSFQRLYSNGIIERKGDVKEREAKRLLRKRKLQYLEEQPSKKPNKQKQLMSANIPELENGTMIHNAA
ncbi:hypothetical protein Tco_0552106 [Tanacetum coccineum]